MSDQEKHVNFKEGSQATAESISFQFDRNVPEVKPEPMIPIQEPKFEFELQKDEKNLTRKYAHKWFGTILLSLSVLGGSSLGVVSNKVPAEGPFLKNAWRFQALMLVAIFMVPFYYLYDRYYLRYERYRAHIRQLQNQGSDLDKIKQTAQQYKEERKRLKQGQKSPREDGEMSGRELSEQDPKSFQKFSEMDNSNIRKTINQTVSSINKSVTLAV